MEEEYVNEYRLFVNELIKSNDVVLGDFNLGYGKPNLSVLREKLSDEDLVELVKYFNDNVREFNRRGNIDNMLIKL